MSVSGGRPRIGAGNGARLEVDARRASLGILALFLAPALLIYAGFTLYPVLRTFYNAFHTIRPQGVVEFVGLGNFVALLSADPVFWKAVVNTALFTIVATIVDVVGGLLLALCLFARAPWAPLLRVVWFTPALMSYVVVGIIWVWIFDYDWGLANATLRFVGLGAFEQSWLGHPSTALWSVLVAHEWKWLGFNMIVFLAALHALPADVLGAAELDHCGWAAKLVYIIAPMLRPTIVNLLVLSFIGKMMVFDLIWVMRYLCGELRVVAARGARTVPDVVGETVAAIFLETAAGAPVEVTGTMVAAGLPPRGPDHLEIVGSKASATFVESALCLHGPDPRSHRYDPERGYQASFDGVIAHFVECLETGAPFETDPADNLETLRLVEHAYWAASLQHSCGNG